MASQQSPTTSLKRSQDSSNDNASRKRQRTSEPSPSPSPQPGNPTTSEERREARAHRNRIAAQNSRDRRKAQFSFLERRVAELEEENRMLRAGIAVPHVLTPSPADIEKEKARERENEELRERIKTLEKGWDAVLKALAAQGLAAQPPSPAPTKPQVTEPTPAQQPVFPLSPAPTQSSPDFDLDLSLPSAFSPDPISLPQELQQSSEPTRHLARVASTKSDLVALQRVDSKRSALPVKILTVSSSMNQQWIRSSARSSVRRRVPRLAKKSSIYLLMTRSPHSRPYRR